ncbi:MAG: MarR family winged helix-turn-helix transcriptional regulator [candidate division WOR-3 bacterium]
METFKEEGLEEASRKAELLLRVICSFIRLHGREVLSRHHLSPPQFEIMTAIYFEGEISQNEMPKKLHLAKSTISALLERLEKQGMISKKKTQSDKRISAVRLTFKGANVIEQVIDRRRELIRLLLKQLTEKQRKEFNEIIARFAYILEAEKGKI